MKRTRGGKSKPLQSAPVGSPAPILEPVKVGRVGGVSSEEIHRALFGDQAPPPQSVEEMKDGLRRSVRTRYLAKATTLPMLRDRVELEIENYRYSAPSGITGIAWSQERVDAELAALRSALVEPHWADVELRDTHQQIEAAPAVIVQVAIVADDQQETMLAFDPIANEFVLVARGGDQLQTIGVRGDAVECFMAR